MRSFRSTQIAGFSFVEVLVTAALVALVFGGLFASVTGMINLIAVSKARSTATALAVERMEYIRSLAYADVGTISGVPAGLIPQTATTTRNNIPFFERILIEYVDDPADGSGGSDSNGIVSDYKRVKVEESWSYKGATSSVVLVSSVMPVGIESTTGGGTIRVNVYDASTQPVVGASVRFVNQTTTSTIDTVRLTNAAGEAILGGAPAAANYEIYVSKAGYSSAQNYVASSSNPNPDPAPVAVLESAVSTMTFLIDEVSTLTITAAGEPTYDEFADTFADETGLGATSSVRLQSGSMVLADTAGVYDASGFLEATTTEPSPLVRWHSAQMSASTSASTSVMLFVLYDTGSGLALVPDSDLPGNSGGFSGSSVDLASLDPATYDALALRAVLSTSDTSETPTLNDWTLTYVTAEPVLSGIPVAIHGQKTIGTTMTSQPIYKYEETFTTDGSGEVELTDMEYDFYTIEMTSGSYKTIETCPIVPYFLAPDSDEEVRFTLRSLSGPFLRVAVVDSAGAAIPGATVLLENAGYSESETTSLCGQTYFNGGSLYSAGDYVLSVSHPSYSPTSIASTTVSSDAYTTVVLPSL